MCLMLQQSETILPFAQNINIVYQLSPKYIMPIDEELIIHYKCEMMEG